MGGRSPNNTKEQKGSKQIHERDDYSSLNFECICMDLWLWYSCFSEDDIKCSDEIYCCFPLDPWLIVLYLWIWFSCETFANFVLVFNVHLVSAWKLFWKYIWVNMILLNRISGRFERIPPLLNRTFGGVSLRCQSGRSCSPRYAGFVKIEKIRMIHIKLSSCPVKFCRPHDC